MVSERVLFSGGCSRNVDVLPKRTCVHLSYYRCRTVLLFVLQSEKKWQQELRAEIKLHKIETSTI
jgi:hypothetical protein